MSIPDFDLLTGIEFLVDDGLLVTRALFFEFDLGLTFSLVWLRFRYDVYRFSRSPYLEVFFFTLNVKAGS